MPLKILADEGVDFRLIRALSDHGFEVISVLREYQGSPDRVVLDLAKRFHALLLTEDSDFGEWIFAHKEKNVSVVFLRYRAAEREEISRSLIKVLDEHGTSLFGKFAVITAKKIRIRGIP